MFTRHNMMSLQGLLCLSIYSKGKGMRSVSRHTGLSVDTINKYISEIEYVSGQKIFTHSHNKLLFTEYGKYVAILGNKIEKILLKIDENITPPIIIPTENKDVVDILFKDMEIKIDTSSAILIYKQLGSALNHHFDEISKE